MMNTAYLILKLVHILGAMVWLGGTVALVVLNARLGREGNPTMMATLGRQSEFFGRMVLGPAMLVTLLAGLVTAGVARFPFTTLWIVWGIIGFVMSILIGVIAVQRASTDLATIAREGRPDEPRLGTARGRLVALNAVNLLVLVSIVAAMVIKPTLS